MNEELVKQIIKLYKCTRVYGPYLCGDGRKRVILHYDKSKHPARALAKVIIEAHLGRLLEKHETVDHIDEDFTNDEIDNLQILTKEENASKSNKIKFTGRTKEVPCDNCGTVYERSLAHLPTKHGGSYKMVNTFCSESCRAKYYGRIYSDEYKGHLATNPWGCKGKPK